MRTRRFHIPSRVLALLALLVLCLTGPAAAEPEISREKALVALEMNRSLLTRFELEYTQLKQSQAAGVSTDSLRRGLENAEYKIKALDEEGRRLMASLPPEEQAQEFMKDMLLKISIRQYKRKFSESAEHPLRKTADFSSVPASSRLLRRTITSTPLVPAAPGGPEPPAQVSQEETIRGMHERALKLVAKQKLAEASRLYEEIVLMGPDDDQAYVIMGHTYLLAGKYEKAERAFQNAVHINASNAGEVTPFYENLVMQNPDDDNAHSNLGYAYLILGDFLSAKEAFVDALGLNSSNEAALEGLRIIERQG